MFRDIDADCYIMTDGDDTYPAEGAPALRDIILAGEADMVIGDRLSSTYFTENKRALHGIGNRMVRFLVNRLYKGDLHDIMSGLRAFSRGFAKNFPAISDGFQTETEMAVYALKHGLTVKEVVIEYRDRPEGSVSKLNTIKDGIKVLKMIAKLRSRY